MTNRLNAYEVHSLTKLPPPVIEALLQGVSKEHFEMLLCGEVGTIRADIARMNCAGSLRAVGYIIPRTKGFYKIVGWEKPLELRPTADWPSTARYVLESVETLNPVTQDIFYAAQDQLGSRPHDYIAHENSFAYLYCYELARDHGFWYPLQDRAAVIIRKFVAAPRFRIFQLTLLPHELLDLASWLSDGSLSPVSILNVTKDECNALKKLDTKGFVTKRPEAIYSTRDIAEHPETFLSKKALRQVKINQGDTILLGEYDRDDPMIVGMWKNKQRSVIETWKSTQEHKHRQLAIGRDRVAVEMGLELNYLAMRDGPVGCYLLDRLKNRPDVVVDIAHKAFNYSSQPGGRSGTNDWMMIEVCRNLVGRGTEFINGGSLDGGGVGLADFKKKWAASFFDSRSFTTSFPHLRRKDLSVCS